LVAVACQIAKLDPNPRDVLHNARVARMYHRVRVPIITPMSRWIRGRSAPPELLLYEVEERLRADLVKHWTADPNRWTKKPYVLPIPLSTLGRSDLPMLQFSQVGDMFMRSEGPGLVILGGPGSGKTTIAQFLWHEFAQADRRAPIPVFLRLAAWNTEQPIEEWVVERLTEDFPWLGQQIQGMYRTGITHTLARELVTRRRVVLILDGLNEIRPEDQAKALAQLDTLPDWEHRMVLTCRTEEYVEIFRGARSYPDLARIPAVELGPLPMADVCAYVSNIFQGANSPVRWESLCDHLIANPDGVLATVLSVALSVQMVRTAYEDAESDPGELIGMSSREEIMHHLLDRLVEIASPRTRRG
jgi:NACHT domain